MAFPLQQWLHERVSLLRYTYIVCLLEGLEYTSITWPLLTSITRATYAREASMLG